MSDPDFSVRSCAPRAGENSRPGPPPGASTILVQCPHYPRESTGCTWSREPAMASETPYCSGSITGQRGDSREWALLGGGLHFCGKGKGGGNFALSSFKRTLFPLGLPLPCLTHKHRYNVYTHALCVDQYRKTFKGLDSKIEHVITSHLSPPPHPNHWSP